MLNKQPYIALSGTTSFPDGWRTHLRIFMVSHTPFTSQPILLVILDTDPI